MNKKIAKMNTNQSKIPRNPASKGARFALSSQKENKLETNNLKNMLKVIFLIILIKLSVVS